MTALRARLSQASPMRWDKAWLASLLLVAAVAMAEPAQVAETLGFAARALAGTAPFILFAVLLIGALKATGAENTLARAFQGRETRMIVLAALVGGLAPFCSCEVIPFSAGLLAAGAPLSAVMAFWLASPLIDPPSLVITAAALGWPFAIAKAVAAVGIGLLGGFAVQAALRLGAFPDPLRPRKSGGCGCGPALGSRKPVWRFWQEGERRRVFVRETGSNAVFLLKWLTLAYLIESLMIAYLPAEAIASVVGGDGVGPVILSAVIGAPVYLNSYAAPALVDGLMTQGMSAGAAMAFMVAGAVSSVPAMTAVFALVKVRVFAAYVVLGLTGAILAGLAYGTVAPLLI